MTAALAAAYPVRVEGEEDARFTQALAHDLGAVLELHGYPPVRANQDLAALQDAIFRYLYVQRGGGMEAVQARLNGAHGPIAVSFTAPGPLSSDDCCASAHELRRVKLAQGAIVIAMDGEERLHFGSASDENSWMAALSDEVFAFLARRVGGATLKDMTYTVDEKGGVS